MIVGLKRRRTSKNFYDLGCLIRREQKSVVHTKFPIQGGKGKVIYSRKTDMCFIKTFSSRERGRIYKYQTDAAWKPFSLIEEICNNEPGKCGKEEMETCPHRFKCLTTRVENF